MVSLARFALQSGLRPCRLMEPGGGQILQRNHRLAIAAGRVPGLLDDSLGEAVFEPYWSGAA
jgi:hypothetical protein